MRATLGTCICTLKKLITMTALKMARYYSTVLAVDLHKALLLPWMSDRKSCIFTSRLVVFNKTFAMMDSQSKKVHYLELWNERITAQSRCDIASTVPFTGYSRKKETAKVHFMAVYMYCFAQNTERVNE